MKKLSNNSFGQQKGFTLIELVVVIVILGILAATAAPKFIDLTSDAKASVMEGVQGSVNSAVNMIHAKALVAGQTGDTGAVKVGTKYYAVEHGYPVGEAVGDGTAVDKGLGLASLIELEANSDITISNAEPAIITHKNATTAANCQLSYANSTGAEERPIITPDLTDC